MQRALVAVLALVACDKHTSVSPDASATPAPSGSSDTRTVRTTPSASATAAPLTPPPPTDYMSLAQAEHDGDKAIGKTVLVSASRGALFADTVKLHVCFYDVTDVRNVRATYTPDKRAVVRAIASVVAPGNCTRVIIRITGAKGEHGFERTAFVDAVDVHAPSMPLGPPPPPGADYGSMDDVLLAGDAAVGKVVQIPIRRTSGTSSNGFDAQACDVSGIALRINYQPTQQSAADALPTGFSPCRAIRMKMKRQTDQREGTWLAELIEAL